MDELFIERMKKLARRECWNADPQMDAYSFSGGNFDDAYNGGYEDGACDMAREVLKKLGIKW
jgi:hypothetical protein